MCLLCSHSNLPPHDSKEIGGEAQGVLRLTQGHTVLGLNPRPHDFHPAAAQLQAVVFISTSNISIYLGWKSEQRLGETNVFSSTVSSSLAPTDERPTSKTERETSKCLCWWTVLTRRDWCHLMDLPCSSDGKESPYNAGDPGSILGSGRFSGEGNDKPLQYSCLENPMERRAWRTTTHGVTKGQKWLSD